MIRTRFAPSPTGHLHIGNARTAILNWLFARHSGGDFIVRVEDTDIERSSTESETAILSDLKWLGLDWDEGPGIEGDAGPYRQSARKEIYDEVLNTLLEKGSVYRCYCTETELNERREERKIRGESTNYDGKCRNLSSEDQKQLAAEGRKYVVRYKSDEAQEVVFTDLVRGEVKFPGSNIGDFVIVRQSGMPMYNFCCAVDDHFMKITHVIRGDDHVSNTPRQVLLYEAMGWEVPVFGHSPMILGANKERLSKRHGATSVSQYRELGYLPEAMVNFLSLLSWSSESGEEILAPARLVEEFDFSRVSKSAAVFDVVKLDWMNGMYIRNLQPNELAGELLPFLSEAIRKELTEEQQIALANLFQEKLERLAQIEEKAAFLFQKEVVPENEEAAAIMKTDEAQKVFSTFNSLSADLDDWNDNGFGKLMKNVQKESGVKGKMLWMPVRLALTGKMHGPDLSGIVQFFGVEKCRRFMTAAIHN